MNEFNVPMHDSSGHRSSVTSVCISPDGLKIVSGAADASIKIWNSETGDVIHTLQGNHMLLSISVRVYKYYQNILECRLKHLKNDAFKFLSISIIC